MRRWAVSLLVVAVTFASATGALAQVKPEFRLGFKLLADQIPSIVGQPLQDEHWGANGDSLQQTTTGLMVWRKADNWTAFTNGARTWVNGPYGVMERGNEERFEWEAPPAPAAPAEVSPTPAPPSPTPVHAGPFTPDVKAMDEKVAGPGASLKQLILEIDGEWAAFWKWRPRKPVTIYLYSDANRMFYEVERITGVPWPEGAKEIRMGEELFVIQDPTTGGWAMLLAFKGDSWGVAWEQMKAKHNLVHGYAHIMTADLEAKNLPKWFYEGLGEYCAFAKAPQTVGSFGTVTAAAAYFHLGYLPSLRDLNPVYWQQMVLSGEAGNRGAYGIAYLAVKYLVEKAGGERVAQVLQATAAGEGFEPALQRITGYTVDQLDAEYRSTFPRAGWTR